MNFLRMLLYPIIVTFTFFGYVLFNNNVPGSSTMFPYRRRSISDDGIRLSPPLFVTPFIQRGQYSEARQRSEVSPDIGGIRTYSGFLTVNKACNNHLFYWFIPAEMNWKKAPLIVWLNGGPGGSSMYGLFKEVGPWKLKNGELIKNEFSWNKIANLLFIDQPVGTGFSFSGKGCFAKGNKDQTGDLYPAIIQFLKMFPELQTNKFFLAGVSFAGHYIPETAAMIVQKNEVMDLKINLAGILIGSPFIQQMCHFKGDLLYELGIADEHDRDLLHKLHNEQIQQIKSQNLKEAAITNYKIETILGDIGLPSYYHILDDEPEIFSYEFSDFLKIGEVKERIHVGSSPHQYGVINIDVFEHYEDDYYGSSSASKIKYLLDKNYIVGLFHGQLDMICPFKYFECVFKEIDWSESEGFLNAANRPWFVSNRLAGWFKVFRNLFTAVIRDGGHSSPEDQSEVLFELIKSVLNSSPEDLLKDLKTTK